MPHPRPPQSSNHVTYTYECRKCRKQGFLSFPKGSVSPLKNPYNCVCGSSDVSKHRGIGLDTKKWYNNTNFRPGDIKQFIDLEYIAHKSGFIVTNDSLRLSRLICLRLNKITPWDLSILPYISKNKLTASSMTKIEDVKRRLKTRSGEVYLTRPNSNSDQGEAVDAALDKSIRYSTIRDGMKTGSSVVVPIDAFEMTITGSTDFGFEESPGELKTITDFDNINLLETRFHKYRTQVGLYQKSSSTDRSFLVIINRSSGQVIGLEACSNLSLQIEQRFENWLKCESFRSLIGEYKENILKDISSENK